MCLELCPICTTVSLQQPIELMQLQKSRGPTEVRCASLWRSQLPWKWLLSQGAPIPTLGFVTANPERGDKHIAFAMTASALSGKECPRRWLTAMVRFLGVRDSKIAGDGTGGPSLLIRGHVLRLMHVERMVASASVNSDGFGSKVASASKKPMTRCASCCGVLSNPSNRCLSRWAPEEN